MRQKRRTTIMEDMEEEQAVILGGFVR